MTINQTYFELRDRRALQGRPWIPLRQATDLAYDPPAVGVVRLSEFVGIATAAIENDKRIATGSVDWSDLNVGAHRSGVEQDGYHSSDIFRHWKGGQLGINLVIDQHLEEENRHVWHLHPDLIVALRLVQEGDSWFRPEEGWAEVARLKRDENREPVLLEMRAEFLCDYLAARGMALYCSSYVERSAVTISKPNYTWPQDDFREAIGRDRREAHIAEATYPDPEDHFWTIGGLWRTEWVDPGSLSVRVRGDTDSFTTSFVLRSDGTRKTANQLAGTTTWLYFEPTLVTTLLRHRGGELRWLTQETGTLGATGNGVHFGVNDLGLITVFAKDIGDLASWEQRLWSAHNVTPDGGVSAELFAAQMEVDPAATVAPEAELQIALEAIDAAFFGRYTKRLLRDHDTVPKLLRRVHRFQVAEADGLLELAKEVTRLFVERIDIDAVIAALALPKEDRKPGSLKIIEKLVAHLRSEPEAKAMMAPLFGIYDLRLADAHLGSSLIDSGKARAGVDDSVPAAMQGRQLIRSLVETIRQITSVLTQK